MPTVVTCPACQSTFNVPATMAGKTVRCPKCTEPLPVRATLTDSVSAPRAKKNPPDASAPSKADPDLTGREPPQNKRGYRLKEQDKKDEDKDESPRALLRARLRKERQEKERRRQSKALYSLGALAIALGLIAFLFAWIPFLAIVSMVLSGLGLIVGFSGVLVCLLFKRSGIGLPAAGSAVSLLALALAVTFTFVLGKGGKDGAEQQARRDQTEQPQLPADKPGQTATTAVPKKPEAPRVPKTQVWVDASTEAAQQGSVRVYVKELSIGSVRFKSFGEINSSPALLKIQLQIENVGNSPFVKYRSWGAAEGADLPTLTDNSGKNYPMASFGVGTLVVGQVAGEVSLSPGRPLLELLVFPVPDQTVQYLRLALPAKNCGGQGYLGLQIPTSLLGAPALTPPAPVSTATAPPPTVTRAIQKHRLALQDKEAQVRLRAAAALAELGSNAAAAVPDLADALRDKEETVRVAAAEALGKIGTPAVGAVPALVRATADLSDPVRRAAAEAASKVGSPTKNDIPILTAALKDENANFRADAALALETIGKEAAGAVPALLEALADRVARVRVRATKALWEIQGRSVRPGQASTLKLAAALKEPDPETRREAAEAIDQITQDLSMEGKPVALSLGTEAGELVSALRAALNDENGHVRVWAAEALWPLTGSGKLITPVLNDALKDRDCRVRLHGAQALWTVTCGRSRTAKMIDPQAKLIIGVLAEGLKDQDTLARREAGSALGRISFAVEEKRLAPLKPRFRVAVPALTAALQDPDALVRREAAGALGKIGSEGRGAFLGLRLALLDPDALVRQAAGGALRKIGQPTQADVPVLVTALREQDVRWRAEAAAILEELGAQGLEAIPDLMQASKDNKEEVRNNAVRALQAMGVDSSATVQHFIDALKDKDGDARIRAVLALGGFGPQAKPAIPSLVSAVGMQKSRAMPSFLWEGSAKMLCRRSCNCSRTKTQRFASPWQRRWEKWGQLPGRQYPCYPRLRKRISRGASARKRKLPWPKSNGRNEMAIRVVCPACRASYNLKDDFEGKKVRCKDCQQVFVADSMPQSPEEEPEEEVAVAERASVKRKGPRGRGDIDASDDAPRPRRGRTQKSTGRQVLIVGLILLAVLGFFAGLGTVAYFMFSEVEQKVSDADKAVLITADQVAAKRPGFKVQPDLGKFRKVRKGFSNYETSYSYYSPDATQGGLFLECTLTIKSVESDAQITYIHATKDFNLGPAWEGKSKPQKNERNDLLRWGDESHCLVLRQEHDFVGNVFVARKGKRVFHFVVAGLAFRDKESFQDLLMPVLQRLESYSP